MNSTDPALAPPTIGVAGSPIFDQKVGGLPSTASPRVAHDPRLVVLGGGYCAADHVSE
jgi:hypothetical protein